MLEIENYIKVAAVSSKLYRSTSYSFGAWPATLPYLISLNSMCQR